MTGFTAGMTLLIVGNIILALIVFFYLRPKDEPISSTIRVFIIYLSIEATLLYLLINHVIPNNCGH